MEAPAAPAGPAGFVPAGAGQAEVLETFMDFPAPLALANPALGLVQANLAWRRQFGEARLAAGTALAPDGLPVALPETPGGGRAAFRRIDMPGRVLVVAGDAALRPELDELRTRILQLERLAATDHLTGAWNRSHFERVVAGELARSLETRAPVSLVLVDVDHFKRVNDTFGHGAGDSVLRELVDRLQDHIRPSDLLFRWGGEEFAVLAPGTGYRGAGRLAEHLRVAVAARPFREVGPVTVSLGVAEHHGDEDARAWFLRLDEALYQAKWGGRDRVHTDRRGNSDQWAGEAGGRLALAWQEAYESGEPDIDAEHRELFARANRVIELSLGQPRAGDGRLEALDDLVEHSRRHFAHEEAILGRAGYAALDKHRRAHAGLLRRAGVLRSRLAAGESSLGAVVEFVAQDVVVRHLLTVDRAFFPLFGR